MKKPAAAIAVLPAAAVPTKQGLKSFFFKHGKFESGEGARKRVHWRAWLLERKRVRAAGLSPQKVRERVGAFTEAVMKIYDGRVCIGESLD